MSEQITEERATAILLANLKGSRKKPSSWLDIAQACRFLKENEKWGLKKMSEFFAVSEYQLRQIDSINDLNSDVRQLVGEGKFGVDESYQLSRLDKSRQAEAAKAAVDMNEVETRQFISLLKANEKMPIAEAKKLTESTRTEKIRILMLPLTPETYARLEEARKKSTARNAHDFVLRIVERYLDDQRKR